MIEEIKKEIIEMNFGILKDIVLTNEVFKILDKYNNQPDFKSAWNELKTNEIAVDKISLDIMQELEQKYNYRIDMEESPYCEVCGHCGEIGCCGIRGFIEEHIKGKTNCKNEDGIVQDLISICEYETEVFKKNDTLNKGIDELIKKYEDELENIHRQWGDDVFHYHTYEKDLYKEIIQALKNLKGE